MSEPPVNATPELPKIPPPRGTIDITDLVEKIKNVWIRVSVNTILNLVKTRPELAWLNLPVIRTVFKYLLTKLITFLAETVEQQAFYFNTALRKSGQARDFIDAVEYKNSLPPTISDEDYEKAERAELLAFRNFVMLTN